MKQKNMSDYDNAIKTLELFNEKAEELLSSTFVKKMFDEESAPSLSWNWKSEEEITNSERCGPTIEDVKAFRFFIEENERNSFGNLKEIYSSKLPNTEFESRLDSARDELNAFLDSDGSFTITYYEEVLTRRRIIDIFVYGGFAHANEEKESAFEELRSVPPFFSLIESIFAHSLAKILETVTFIKNLNLEALEELKIKRP